MTARVVYVEHILVPHKRIARECRLESIESLDPKWPRPYIALLNGEAVLRAGWDRRLAPGDCLAFVDVHGVPQGGGKSNPMQLVAMLAVMIYAPQLAPKGLVALIGKEAAGSVMTVIGMALINAVIPPPKPPSPIQMASMSAPSPTYNIAAQGNQARLEQAIPEHFGRMIVYPDFAAQPYTEYYGNEQYLYQLLCIGRGEYATETPKIEDTPITSFDEITCEIIPPGGTLTLFPSNVTTSIEVAGQTLDCRAGTYSRTGTTVTVTLANHGLTAGKQVYLDFTTGAGTDGSYAISNVATNTFDVTDTASGTTSGNVTVSPWVGGFIASAAGTGVNYLGVDFVLPRGLYYVDGNGLLNIVSLIVTWQSRPVDGNGNPTGAWTTMGQHTYTAGTTTPQRYSERASVALGRYEVRMRRMDIKQSSTSYGHEVTWAGLRAYLPEVRNFGDVTLIAMRMKASNNLTSQSSHKVNLIATRKLPIWNGSTWSANTATRSPAWAMAYACKQMSLTDAQIDLATLLSLDATWAARGDYFDARFDSFMSFWEAVTKIGEAGRAKPYMQGGVFRVFRDQAASLPVAMFSVRNIVRGSFSIEYLMPTPETADAIDVGYFDKYVWAQRRVRAKLPGSAAVKPVKMELFGVTEREQAFREGMYQAACNRYRRKHIKFKTEMEGFIPSFGDLIAVQHDMPAWGSGGDIIAWNAGTRTATLSEPVSFGAGTHYIALRKLDGSVDGPYVVTAGAQSNQVVLGSAPAYTPITGLDKERTHCAFGSGYAYMEARVLSVKPLSLTHAEIEAVNEDPSVHTAENGQTAPTRQVSQLASYTTKPEVKGLTAVSMPGAPEKMLLSWEPSPWADYYIVEQSADNLKWTRIPETRASNITAIALYGSSTIVRVAAVGAAIGPWAVCFYGAMADYMWAADETTLMWAADDTKLMWKY